MKPKEIAELFKALSAEKRVEIIEMLKEGPCCVGDMAKKLSISEPATSQHLRILKSLGLVEDQRDGCNIHYFLCPEKLGELSDIFVIVCSCNAKCCVEEEEEEKEKG